MALKCVFGGRFQPPHPGHFTMYKNALAMFKEVYVVSSNKIEENSPFSFEEKKFIWKNMFDVEIHFSSNPTFLPKEILEPDDVLVCITSEKDAARYHHTKFFEPYTINSNETWETKAYYHVLPITEDNLSATYIRQNIKYNKTLFEEIYGKFDQEIYDLFNSRIT